MEKLLEEKFTTKSGLNGIVKHLAMKFPNEAMKQIFENSGCNSNWFCGYVIIPKTHPMYKKHYNDVPVSVHGGLTYGEKSFDSDDWIFGFDCNHYEDMPDIQDKEYTIQEIEKLAYQLSQLKTN